jgi:hypothetical protein
MSRFKKQKAGISILEVILVLAISGVIFVIVIATFNSRRRTTYDDAARQVASEIQAVVNESQSGLGPTIPNTDPKYPRNGEELFGESIEFRNNCPAAGRACLMVSKLKRTPSGQVLVYEQYRRDVPQGLLFYIPSDTSPACPGQFTSCYAVPPGTNFGLMTALPIRLGQRFDWNFMIVVRNNTGAEYAFSKFTFGVDANAPVGTTQYERYMGPDASQDTPANYSPTRQGRVRIALGLPGQGADLDAQMADATFRYYITMDLSGSKSVEMQVAP